MRAYVFLSRGGVDPLSGFVWPRPGGGEPGAWVDRSAAPAEALRGYPAHDLPYWFDDELWNVELAGGVTRRDHLLLSEHARLVRRIEAWAGPIAWELVVTCARRVAHRAARALREVGRGAAAIQLEEAPNLEDLELAARAAADPSPAGTLAGYVADVCIYARDAPLPAQAAGVVAKMSAYALAGNDEDAGERLAQERAWQAAWLVDRLRLDEPDVSEQVG